MMDWLLVSKALGVRESQAFYPLWWMNSVNFQRIDSHTSSIFGRGLLVIGTASAPAFLAKFQRSLIK